jgi:hypothetical protein
MDTPSPEINIFHGDAELVNLLNKAAARFVVCGGWAVYFYGAREQDNVADLDLLIEPTEENGRKIIPILNSIGCTVNDPASKFETPNLQIQLKNKLYMYEIDILTPPISLEFGKLWENSIPWRINQFPVRILSKEDLILHKESKEIREKDKEDILKLKAA